MKKILKGQVLRDNSVINTAQMPYEDIKGFFIALVSICDELKVDVPIWTAEEDKLLNKKGEVYIRQTTGEVLRIFSESS